ncbi:MAG: MFS transporter, partial [Actinomycetes bacterium]
MSDLRELARLPHFRAFLAARIISNLGNGMAPVALAFAVLGLPNATATSLSIILGVQAAVVVAVLPFGGVWADRIGRIRAIAGSDMILGLLLIAQAVLFLTHLITVPM